MPLIRKISVLVCMLFLTALRVYTPAEAGFVVNKLLTHATLSSESQQDKISRDLVTLSAQVEEEKNHQDDNSDCLFFFADVPVYNWSTVAVLKNESVAIPVGKRAGPGVAFYLLFCSLRIPSC